MIDKSCLLPIQQEAFLIKIYFSGMSHFELIQVGIFPHWPSQSQRKNSPNLCGCHTSRVESLDTVDLIWR